MTSNSVINSKTGLYSITLYMICHPELLLYILYNQYHTRQHNDYRLPAVSHDFAINSISYVFPKTINSMDHNIKDKMYTHSFNGFKAYIKRMFLESYNTDCTIFNCYIFNY